MKYASAMKYGGELVAAVDCDYNSFKELGTQCPECKEPVYLRIGGQRESVKGKAYQIGPHWCHFKGISAEQVSGCELRVNGYTEKDRAKIAAQARGQRLKLLQRWFWRVFVESHELMGFPVREIVAAQKPYYKNYLKTGQYSLLENVIFVMTELEDPPINAKLLLDDISFAVSQKKCVATTGGVSISSGIQKKFIEQYADNSFVLSRLADHSFEVWAFLHAKQNRPLLEDLVSLGIYNVFDTIVDGIDYEFSLSPEKIANRINGDKYEVLYLFDSPKDLHRLGALVSEAVCVWISTIPWASEFQRLESEAKQRKDAA